jgi:hypothetical protein
VPEIVTVATCCDCNMWLSSQQLRTTAAISGTVQWHSRRIVAVAQCNTYNAGQSSSCTQVCVQRCGQLTQAASEVRRYRKQSSTRARKLLLPQKCCAAKSCAQPVAGPKHKLQRLGSGILCLGYKIRRRPPDSEQLSVFGPDRPVKLVCQYISLHAVQGL